MKKKSIIEPQNMSTHELINALSRCHSRHKVNNICKKLLKTELEKIAKI